MEIDVTGCHVKSPAEKGGRRERKGCGRRGQVHLDHVSVRLSPDALRVETNKYKNMRIGEVIGAIWVYEVGF